MNQTLRAKSLGTAMPFQSFERRTGQWRAWVGGHALYERRAKNRLQAVQHQEDNEEDDSAAGTFESERSLDEGIFDLSVSLSETAVTVIYISAVVALVVAIM